jgi:hypothetical protein
MRLYKCIIIFFFCLLPVLQLPAQGDANTILQSVYAKLQKAKDYSVQANIKVDMPFIRILPVDVIIYFRQDNKFKVESKSIAVVPRQGFDQISKMLDDASSFTSMVQGEEKLGDVQTTIVNVIPLSDTSDLILGKLWVDPLQSVILKSQLTTRSNGTIVTEYSYGSQLAFGLPDQMIFSLDVSKFKMPNAFNDEMRKNNAGKTVQVSGNGNGKGKIYIVMTSYKINQGIPDSVFTK